MHDIIAVSLIWIISLLFAFTSSRQSKGIDWYAPVTKRLMMIMTMVNISILSYLMVMFLVAFKDQTNKMMTMSLFCIIAIICLSRFYIFKRGREIARRIFAKFSKEKENVSGGGFIAFNSGRPTEETKAETDGEDAMASSTLRDMFLKILTWFNVLFCVSNLGYIIYLCYSLEITIIDVDIMNKLSDFRNSILCVHSTILFWTSLSAAFLTAKKWQYSDGYKHTREYDAEFYATRITDRNR